MSKLASEDALEAAAVHIFELSKMIRLASQRQKRSGKYELTDYEFLMLDALREGDNLTVGELQSLIGVSASQMSRVIRSLEDPERGKLVTTSINRRDKRKFNMSITPEGMKAVEQYRRLCINRTMEMLSAMSPKERAELVHIFDRMREIFSQKTVTTTS